jgi:hypothetical protein
MPWEQSTGFGEFGLGTHGSTLSRATVILQPCEARWFVAGDIDSRPRTKARSRVDSYHLDTLTETSAWKRRGGGSFDHKQRIGPARPIVVNGVRGVSEQWSKRRVAAVDLSGTWLDVRKQLWTWPGVQLCRLSVAGDRWWSLALESTGTAERLRPIERPELDEYFPAWRSIMHSTAVSCSYPRWLLDRNES